jgi:hypothetical protein
MTDTHIHGYATSLRSIVSCLLSLRWLRRNQVYRTKTFSQSSSEETTAALLFSLSLSLTLSCLLFLAAAAGDTIPDARAQRAYAFA